MDGRFVNNPYMISTSSTTEQPEETIDTIPENGDGSPTSTIFNDMKNTSVSSIRKRSALFYIPNFHQLRDSRPDDHHMHQMKPSFLTLHNSQAYKTNRGRKGCNIFLGRFICFSLTKNIMVGFCCSRRDIHKRVVSVPIKDVEGSRLKGESSSPPYDSWAWRKYGQKPIKGSPYPRYVTSAASFARARV